MLVGFSMGTGEVASYISRYGSHRVAKAVFIGALQPFMLKTDENPSGAAAQEDVDGMLDTIRADRYAFFTASYRTSTRPTRTSALGSARRHCETVGSWLRTCRRTRRSGPCRPGSPIGARDIDKIDVPTLIMHGTGDRNVPIDITSRVLAKMLPSATYSRSRAPRTACCGRTARRSTRPSWTSWHSFARASSLSRVHARGTALWAC